LFRVQPGRSGGNCRRGGVNGRGTGPLCHTEGGGRGGKKESEGWEKSTKKRKGRLARGSEPPGVTRGGRVVSSLLGKKIALKDQKNPAPSAQNGATNKKKSSWAYPQERKLVP